ncbi:hypothetical protein LIER_38761 [Lithospermum erythrorhizon]|uniref:Endonuclease/exonuclease/phosphatase domain-containing protein n=1 Tax=Lithospermum erythrorhizon TaxID=34254 RepID=A0AAV3Q7K9_LITER
MDEFNHYLEHIDVTELASDGDFFTWCRYWKGRGCCLRKLDHTFSNKEWWNIFPSSFVHVREPGLSDHCALIISLNQEAIYDPYPFKYKRFWEEHPLYYEILKKS